MRPWRCALGALQRDVCRVGVYLGAVRKDHRPYWLKRATAAYNQLWAEHFLCPQFDAVGPGLRTTNPRYIEVQGCGVRIGRDVHMMATIDRPIRFTSFPQQERWGDIEIGDYTIVLPGVRLASAISIRVGKNCMFANNAYVSDADWHDVYDRTEAPGAIGPVVLEDNVWIGDSVIVCKGVTIGENSVIGAGAVVSRDIPKNTIAVGNPAVPTKEIDPAKIRRLRADLFHGEISYDQYIDNFERWVLGPNRLSTYLRARLWPTREL